MIDFKSVVEIRRNLTKVYLSVLCKMRTDEVKIFVFILFFLELFTNLNSGPATGKKI